LTMIIRWRLEAKKITLRNRENVFTVIGQLNCCYGTEIEKLNMSSTLIHVNKMENMSFKI